jgi:4-hydroxy-tetrahydrodipicolinate reductase
MKQPTLALIGYGKMGREIEQEARIRGLTVTAIVDSAIAGRALPLEAATLQHADVCIEFTAPDAAVDNIRACAACGKQLVVGTTGWLHRLGEVEAIVREANIGLIYASNFSIGVHLFLRIVREAARVFDPHAQYDAAVRETHHRMKKDAPSGTALWIARDMLQLLSRKSAIATGADGAAPTEETLTVSAQRVGSVPGIHEVTFDSAHDTILLQHIARSRRGFAEGTLAAAEWIAERKGLYTIEDMLHA